MRGTRRFPLTPLGQLAAGVVVGALAAGALFVLGVFP